MEYLILVLLGVITGLTAGLLGIGGGMIIVPGLAWIFKYYHGFDSAYMHLAAGTSLCIMIFSSISNTYSCYKQKRIEWGIFRQCVPWIIASNILGALIAGYLRSRTLEVIFGLVVLFMAFRMLYDLWKKSERKEHTKFKPEKFIPRYISAFVSCIIGLKSGLLGVGGGIITTPFLTSFGVPIKRATGTSASFTLPISVTGTISFIIIGYMAGCKIPQTFGYIYWPAVVLTAPFSMLFVSVGAYFSNKMNPLILKIVFICFLFYLSIKTFI